METTATKKTMPTVSAALISATKALLMAQAYTQTIRPIVEAYSEKIFNEMKPVDALTGKPQLKFKDAWCMSDADFTIYWQRCKIERDKAGLKVEKDEFCPLLVAEDLERQAQRCMVDAAKYITGMDADDVLCSSKGLENYKKLTELIIGLVMAWARDHKINMNALKD